MNKYYVRRIKKLLEKNTHYESLKIWDEPVPYIMTNTKDYYKLMEYIKKLLKENKENE